ncbi:hypothetical protein JMN32_06065 [Fulvivirga sp. 29W222]|uniref:Transporter n=1 Tax=Fulvivirga marina TaxID=2494733 RepID=A0A937KD47_9BACT|nr:hypothetical protein [Fulvivirga marina]MBL6445863.1 hypothetical protein [Fulvivirga marina]
MKKLLLILICLGSFMQVHGQGCSDAGFCTMGAMSPGQVYTKKINFKLRALELNQYRGTTKLSPIINVTTLDFTFGITENTSFQVKFPYQWVKGNLGKTSGLGDISYSFTHNFKSTEKYHINATLGGKIPSGKSDLEGDDKLEFTSDGQPHDLPMYYQVSLGTWDIVAGASFISKKWMFATGIQIPVAHNNQNDFQYEQWNEYPDPNYLRSHHLASDLKRGTDVMVRAERAFHFSNLDIRLGVLPIFRVTKDEITENGERVKLDGTTGMALSGILGVAYHFNVYHTAKILLGHKFTDRDVNPDGLTRDDVASLAYVIRF